MFRALTEPDPDGRNDACSIALYEPDIPQNTGTILRLAACLGVEAHIIEPAGFPVSDRAFRRAGMDYLDQVTLRRHASWAAFDAWRRAERLRLVLFTTRGGDLLSRSPLRRRRAAVRPRIAPACPTRCIAAADAPAHDPDAAGLRSLNVAMAARWRVGEAMRQTGGIARG